MISDTTVDYGLDLIPAWPLPEYSRVSKYVNDDESRLNPMSPSKEAAEGQTESEFANRQSDRNQGLPSFFTESAQLITESFETETDERIQSEARHLLSVVSELEWCFRQESTENAALAFRPVKKPENLSWTDSVKIAIEASTGSEWDWWPLRSPGKQACSVDSQWKAIEISWQCVSRHYPSARLFAEIIL